MKVVIVSKALIASTYRRKLEELSRLGADVTAVVPPSWREAGGVQRLEPWGEAPYRLVVAPLIMNGHFHTHFYPTLGGILRRERPHVVHIDEEPYNLATFLGVRAALRVGAAPLFFTWQNIARPYPLPFSALEKRVYRSCRLAIAGTDTARDVLREKGFRGEVAVVPQFGVDTELFHPRAGGSEQFVVGFLNRLIPAKAPLLALEAFATLPSDSRMVVIGDGPLRDRLMDDVRRRGLESRVEIRRRVPSLEMPGVLRNLSAVILPSLSTPSWKEQFGRILIEAMASGVPVIGSRSGEIPNVVGDAGHLVPEGDMAALAQALRRLHDDASLSRHLAQIGRERAVSRFSNERIAGDTYAAYQRALELRPLPH